MKIGILTYHCVPNFGAQLQTLSTIAFLRNHGYEPIVLNWYPKDLEEFYNRRGTESQNMYQLNFARENMPLSQLCRTIPELVMEIERLGIEHIILGSDALFDYIPEKYRCNFSLKKLKRIPITVTSNHLLPNPFWGSFNDFIEKTIRIYGYAISSQNIPFNDLSSQERKEIKRLLKGFKILTVRDEWTKQFAERIGDCTDVSVVPDPVFALNNNFKQIPSKQQIIDKFGLPEDYILISFFYDKLPNSFINELIHKLETVTTSYCVSFPMPDCLRRYDTKYKIDLPLDPLDWYALIKYSRGYIGERMHPIIVCLHNSIPFFCFDQYGAKRIIIPRIWTKFSPESSKIYDVLKRAKLSEYSCFYGEANKLTTEDIVNKFLSFDKTKCSEFSKSQLDNYNNAMSKLLLAFHDEGSDS